MEDVYEVIITPTAQGDLLEIGRYVKDITYSKRIAKALIDNLAAIMLSLKVFPERAPLIKENSFRTKGVRVLISGIYLIYYQIREEQKKVFILAVIKANRDQSGFLEHIEIQLV